MDTVYSLEVWVPDGERWHWSAIGAYPTLDMAVAVGEGFLSVKPYRVRRVTDVGDGFHDFLAEEVFANALTGRMRLAITIRPAASVLRPSSQSRERPRSRA